MKVKDINYLSEKAISSLTIEFDIELHKLEGCGIFKLVFQVDSTDATWNYEDDGSFEDYFNYPLDRTLDLVDNFNIYYWSIKNTSFICVQENFEFIKELIYRYIKNEEYRVLKRKNYANISSTVEIKYKNEDVMV